MNSITVWTIYYKIRMNADDSWRRHEWCGPCGMGMVWRNMHKSLLYDSLMSRPVFFRTRALARQRAKELDVQLNNTWIWCKHSIRPFILSWTERN